MTSGEKRSQVCMDRVGELINTGDFSGPHGNYKAAGRTIDALEVELNSLLGYTKEDASYVKLEMNEDRSIMLTQNWLTYPLTKENLLELF